MQPKTSLAMFSGDEPKALETVDAATSKSSTMEASTTAVAAVAEGEVAEPIKAVYKNLARGGKMEEVKWEDPAMYANTNPFEMEWWAYILFGFPMILLLNDFLHFLPKEGPLAFMSSM
jgi:hypothetical protein